MVGGGDVGADDGALLDLSVTDLEEPGLQALVDTGRICKGHSSRREAGAGLSGAWSGLPENSHHILQDGLGGRPDPGFQCL